MLCSIIAKVIISCEIRLDKKNQQTTRNNSKLPDKQSRTKTGEQNDITFKGFDSTIEISNAIQKDTYYQRQNRSSGQLQKRINLLKSPKEFFN